MAWWGGKGGKGHWQEGGKGHWQGSRAGASRGPPVPADFQLNPEARFAGSVAFYNKWRGYGFLELDEKGIVPEDRVFVIWSNLESVDRFPFLSRGMDVEFNLIKWRDEWSGAYSLRAKSVTLPGGGSIALQDGIDKQKEFIGSQELRYTGTLKFYDDTRGFGYVRMDPGYHVGPEVPSELRVERAEVNAGGSKALVMKDVPVEFGIWKTKRGACKVYNMTFPGGLPMTQEAMENRAEFDGARFTGEVKIYKWGHSWGFIELDGGQQLNATIQEKLSQQREDSRQKAASLGKPLAEDLLIYFRKSDCKPGAKGISRGSKVVFSLYIDDKGVGASDLELAPPQA